MTDTFPVPITVSEVLSRRRTTSGGMFSTDADVEIMTGSVGDGPNDEAEGCRPGGVMRRERRFCLGTGGDEGAVFCTDDDSR